ncbi:TPA: DUF2922 domain-containing protein [Clostridioides difficile]|nr:DUF2922 domain-containing protein [Clostridioides difficile]HBH3615648.1 DUF2922 domain-containing protein [Clostridioides difficile]
MDGIEVKLLMTFMTEFGRKVSLFVTDPREDITEAEIKAVMDLIVEKNIFAPSGEDIISAKEAKIVQTETTEFDLVVA